MLEKMKAKIIRLLGGYTKQEYRNIGRARFFAGKSDAYLTILSEMWGNYGKTADEWCKKIYDFAEKQYYSYNIVADSFTINHEYKRTSTEP